METKDPTDAGERAVDTAADHVPANRLHPVAAIQPCGLLLVLSEDWQIEGASANSAEIIGHTPAEMIGRPACNFLADDAIHALRNRLALLRDPAGVERLFSHRLLSDDQRFDIAIHCRDERVILEAESATAKPYGDTTGTLRGMLARLDQAGNRAAFLAEGARQLRALTGFDRVMALRFDQDGASEVVAEYARGGIGSLLGTHWPEAPLPANERQWLARASLHLTADVDAATVEVLAIDSIEKLDFDAAVLCPPPPAYAAALRSLGVRASMTIALIVDGALWGAIACHHSQPRRPAFERRAIAGQFAQLFAMRLEILELKDALARRG